MPIQTRFPRAFEARVVDYPTTGPDVAVAAAGAGAQATAVFVDTGMGATWTGTFSAPDPGARSLTALLGTPTPTGLCVVERGTGFIGDVKRPESFVALEIPGPVTGAAEVVDEGVLALVTPWFLVGIGAGGVLWTSSRIAINGIRVDEAASGWLRGVADPNDDESRDFAIELATGRVIGGAGVL